MKVAPLIADLESIAAEQPAAWPFVRQVREAAPDFASCAPLVAAAAAASRLCAYRATALMLKLLAAERSPSLAAGLRALGRPPWRDAMARVREPLANLVGSLPAAELELLMIEQHALACDTLGAMQIASLAERYDHERTLLSAATAAERAAFTGDKRIWLLDEIQLDELYALRQQLVDELESTRIQYLTIVGAAAVDLVEAAHRVALLRYRVALNDPTLTAVELNLRLQHDLAASDSADAAVRLEPELRRALQDSLRGVQADYDLLRYVDGLRDEGRLKPASPEDRKEAELEFRRLARLIHPDALQRHPKYAEIDPQNERRLKEIWHQASATHGVRVRLSRDRLLDYLQHLRQWKEEVLRILCNLSFPAPSLLLQGDTLDERHVDLRRAMADVLRHLDAVRDDIAALEFDPLHGEYRRVIAMGEEARAAEREHMATLAEAWNAEAMRLAALLAARAGASTGEAPHGSLTNGAPPGRHEERS